MVGQVVDAHGYHGILFRSPGRFVLYDYPDADLTDFEGINNMGQICGSYFDGTVHHGFVVRAKRTTGE
jgi:hypothetical protein